MRIWMKIDRYFDLWNSEITLLKNRRMLSKKPTEAHSNFSVPILLSYQKLLNQSVQSENIRVW